MSAVKEARLAISCFAMNIESYCLAGAALLNTGKIDEAYPLLEKASLMQKSSHPLLGNQDLYWDVMRYGLWGNCLISKGETSKAINAFENLLMADPNDESIKELVNMLRDKAE